MGENDTLTHAYSSTMQQRLLKFYSNFPLFSYEQCFDCLLLYAKLQEMDMVLNAKLVLLKYYHYLYNCCTKKNIQYNCPNQIYITFA